MNYFYLLNIYVMYLNIIIMTSKISYFLEYFKYLKNPIQCLLFKFGLKKTVVIKFKNHAQELELSDTKSIDTLMILIRQPHSEYFDKVCTDDNIITFKYGINIYNPRFYPLNSIFWEYYDDYYPDFNVDYKNRNIIDIGANAGDSALFFASCGSKVWGFEPVKEYFEMANKNIQLNSDLKDNIKIFNYGVSYKKGKLNIGSMDSVSDYIQDNDSYEVDILSMDDILNHVEPDLLKMDCEGCEFEIIENCDLSMFNELIFEYHSEIVGRDHKSLVDKLESQGFKIEFFSVFGKDLKDLGFIHAYK